MHLTFIHNQNCRFRNEKNRFFKLLNFNNSGERAKVKMASNFRKVEVRCELAFQITKFKPTLAPYFVPFPLSCIFSYSILLSMAALVFSLWLVVAYFPTANTLSRPHSTSNKIDFQFNFLKTVHNSYWYCFSTRVQIYKIRLIKKINESNFNHFRNCYEIQVDKYRINILLTIIPLWFSLTHWLARY